jgi:penicillin-binding protein 2
MKYDPFSIYNSNFGTKKKSGPALSWEESINGSNEDPDDYYEGHGSGQNSFFFITVLCFIFLILGGRLAYLQIRQGEYYSALALGNHVRTQDILAPRGLIHDSQGEILVQNVPSFELVATPVDLPKEGTEEIARRVSEIIPFNVEETVAKLKKIDKSSFNAVSVAENLTREQALLFEARASEFAGFSVQNNPIREYKDPHVFSHALGYTGKINEAELAEKKNDDSYILNDYIGKAGIEITYEDHLKGENGKRQIEVDARGQLQKVLGEIDPEPGLSLVLNIDAELQRKIYDEMLAKNPGKKGAAVAVNPQTGEILALVSLPGFDSNLFAKGISQKDYASLVNDQNRPLLNRAVAGTYPPGSTIKSVMAAAALQEGVVDENTKIFDNGDLVYNGYHFRGWKRDGLGLMDVRSAIAMSSDIYFYTIGGGQAALNIEGLGPERIEKYDYLFGMGQKLGIDLPSEATGRVASPSWKKSYFKTRELQTWYPGNTYHISIGQGDMLATPLQVTMWTAAVANGGTLYRPYVVNRVTDIKGNIISQNKSEVIRAGFIDPKNIEIVRQGMRQTVTDGTARSMNTLPIAVAGKTGTAQFDGGDLSLTHAWFTAFAPYEDPKIAITVLIENGGEGSSAASPVVKKVFEWWAANRNH